MKILFETATARDRKYSLDDSILLVTDDDNLLADTIKDWIDAYGTSEEQELIESKSARERIALTNRYGISSLCIAEININDPLV